MRANELWQYCNAVTPLGRTLNILGITSIDPNGVWNLVLACFECNHAKLEIPPERVFFEKLLTRNLYFSVEHQHAMKFSVLYSLGISNASQLRAKHVEIYNWFEMFEKWKPKEVYP